MNITITIYSDKKMIAYDGEESYEIAGFTLGSSKESVVVTRPDDRTTVYTACDVQIVHSPTSTVEQIVGRQATIHEAMEHYRTTFRAQNIADFVYAEHLLRTLLNDTNDNMLTQEQIQVRVALNRLHEDAVSS